MKSSELTHIVCLFDIVIDVIFIDVDLQESNFCKGFNSYAVVMALEQNNEKESMKFTELFLDEKF